MITLLRLHSLFETLSTVAKLQTKSRTQESQGYYSGALAARRVAKRSPILIWERKGNPSMNFLMVIMASGIARWRVRTTTTTTATESSKMASVLQKIGWQRHAAFVYRLPLWYWTSMLWSTQHLSRQGICWPVSRDHIAGSSVQLIKVTCFFEVNRWPSAVFRFDRALICHVCIRNWPLPIGAFQDQWKQTMVNKHN